MTQDVGSKPWFGIVACLLLSAPQPVAAAEWRHTAGPDETWATVAKNYYGAAWKGVYITARNGLADDNPLPNKVIVPASWNYRVKRGDSLAAIARRFLGDTARYKAIVQFNPTVNPADLSPGTTLLMPFHLQHTVQKGESLATISRRYYRTPRKADILREYNGRSNSSLEPGDKIVVPIFDPDTVDPKKRAYEPQPSSTPEPALSSRSKPLHEKESAQESQKPTDLLRAALSEYSQGLFAEGCFKLEKLLGEPSLDQQSTIAVIQHLGFCAIAGGDERAARDYFRKWLEIDPNARLHPITTSPKILLVFEDVVETARASSGGLQQEK